jgi:hypothetical protein
MSEVGKGRGSVGEMGDLRYHSSVAHAARPLGCDAVSLGCVGPEVYF